MAYFLTHLSGKDEDSSQYEDDLSLSLLQKNQDTGIIQLKKDQRRSQDPEKDKQRILVSVASTYVKFRFFIYNFQICGFVLKLIMS